MESILKYLLYIIFLVSLLTGVNILIGGALAVPGATIGVEAKIDNELRYFSMFWVAYGGFCFWVARNISERHNFIPFIAFALCLGGVGRLVSVLLVGTPGSFLLTAMLVEFVLPLVIYLIYQKQRKNQLSAVTSHA